MTIENSYDHMISVSIKCLRPYHVMQSVRLSKVSYLILWREEHGVLRTMLKQPPQSAVK